MAKKADAIKKEINVVKEIDSIDERKALILLNLTQYLERKKFEERQNYITKLKTILPIKKNIKITNCRKRVWQKVNAEISTQKK